MRRYVQWIPAVLFALATGVAFADEQAVKEHEEMGKKGVTPHMMKGKDKEIAAKEREEAKKRHMEEGIKGVTPHALNKKQKAAAADKDAMKKHEEMGKKDVYPEGKPDTGK